MYLLDPLVACPACSCHARRTEETCPHCGAALRREDGSTPRTAGAILLGLLVATAVPAMASCSSSVESGAGGNGGGAATTTSGSTTKTTGSTTTSTTSSEGCGGWAVSADYGVPPTTPPCEGTGGGK